MQRAVENDSVEAQNQHRPKAAERADQNVETPSRTETSHGSTRSMSRWSEQLKIDRIRATNFGDAHYVLEIDFSIGNAVSRDMRSEQTSASASAT